MTSTNSINISETSQVSGTNPVNTSLSQSITDGVAQSNCNNVFDHNIPKGLTLCSHNINHISNKLDELRYILECEKPDIDVYGICETFLTIDVHDDTLNIQGYRLVRRDRNYGAGGGIILYIKDGLNFKRREDLESQNDNQIEAIWVELKLSNKSLLVCQAYRPPNATNLPNWLNYMGDSLQLAYSENKSMVLMGDLNIDLLKQSPISDSWADIYSSFELEQIIDEIMQRSRVDSTIIKIIETAPQG